MEQEQKHGITKEQIDAMTKRMEYLVRVGNKYDADGVDLIDRVAELEKIIKDSAALGLDK